MKRSTTEAKASLSSNRSMSEAFMPARASAFAAASGPVSMIVGSEPMEANERMRARGFRPAFAPDLGTADQHGGGAVDDARRIAGVVHVLDALHSG
jgi:hypothetical protein